MHYAYDLFISYARVDNQRGQVTALKEQIEADYQAFDPGSIISGIVLPVFVYR